MLGRERTIFWTLSGRRILDQQNWSRVWWEGKYLISRCHAMFWFIWSTLWSLNPVLLFPEVMCCWTFLSIPAAKFFGFICLGQESTFYIFKTNPHTCVKFNRKRWKLSLISKIYRGIIFKDLSFEKLFIFQINRISAYFVSYVQRILHGRKHQGLKHIEKSPKK